MSRVWKQWTPDKVEDALVAPHRFLWSGAVGPNGASVGDLWAARSYDEAKACYSYVEGDVVYIESGYDAVKFRIIARLYSYRDRHGDRAEVYRGVRETRKGLWSKQWEDVHPGFIQRGYQRAGLAPDVDAFQPLTKKAGA